MVTFSMNGGNRGALSARSLINNKTLSKTRRALLGSAVLRGEYDLKPTVKDVARMVGCSVAYLQVATKLSPVRLEKRKLTTTFAEHFFGGGSVALPGLSQRQAR